ncbi:hypothetical protein [Microcella sp.]|uniref:hypothetical protein n=1 Tax=Microcella sp. TaxID=1913979 RepID=UPI00299F832B|nr:hypothetical protein [Microcella sp.]MDX2025285.1 hypothetical protein [Microcella sp.]
MADGNNLDDLMRRGLTDAAQPADPTGVADALRARVDGGDAGVTVSSSVAPGWGGLAVRSWLPWVTVVAVAIVGGTLGALAFFGGSTIESTDARPVVVESPSVDSQSCAERPAAGGVCPTSEQLVDSPAPSDDPSEAPPAPETDPDPDRAPAPPSDTTPPTVQQVSIDSNPCPAVIEAVASDNVGVTQVTLSWSGVATGSAAMSLVSGTWRYLYDSENLPEGTMTFTAVARDAAGNASGPMSATDYVVCVL